MLSIIVFGAAGGTGQKVVEQALNAGYKVTAIVRNPAAFPLHHPQLATIKGDVFDPASFDAAMAGKDIVLSCLGARNRAPTTLYSQGTQHIMQAMQAHNIERLICLSAGAVAIPPKASWGMKFLVKNILQPLLGNVYRDMLIMEKIVSSSALNWTIIRPPRLTNGKYTGHYRMAIHTNISHPSSLSRADLADAMLQNMYNNNTYQSLVEVSY